MTYPRSPEHLVVVPTDPIEAYERKGLVDLHQYYNPCGLFDRVTVLSPLETRDRQMQGLNVIATTWSGWREDMLSLKPSAIRVYATANVGWLACVNKVPDIPLMVSLHDINPVYTRPVAKLADVVICVSQQVKRYALRMGVEPSRIRVLPNRVDLSHFTPSATDMPPVCPLPGLDADAKCFWVLHVGRKSQQKNLTTVIASLTHLPNRVRAVFVGPGDPDPYKRETQRLGVSERCVFVGPVPQRQLREWYRWCDAMVTPSLWEGFGNVFVEAAACGALVVTSNRPPMNENFKHGETAWLVDQPVSPQCLAKAVAYLMAHPEVRRRVRYAAPRAALPFEKVQVDMQEASIYNDLLRCPPRSLTLRDRAASITSRTATTASLISFLRGYAKDTVPSKSGIMS